MNSQNLTAKSAEALNSAQSLAREYGNREIDEQHLLLALLTQEGGLVPNLFAKMGADKTAVERMAREAV